MLVLKRREGQWTDVVHESSGDVLRIRVCQIEAGFPGHLNLAFDDSARNFSIERPERNKQRPEPTGEPSPTMAFRDRQGGPFHDDVFSKRSTPIIPVDPKYYDPDKR